MTASVVMRVVGYARDIPCPYAGQYLMEFTPDADVKGTFTPDITKAKRYPSSAALFAEWRHAIGVRRDGQPDRPLTAFTIETVQVP